MRALIFLLLLCAGRAWGGEIADCAYDRAMEYATNGGPANPRASVHEWQLILALCVGRDLRPGDVEEIEEGFRRALVEGLRSIIEKHREEE